MFKTLCAVAALILAIAFTSCSGTANLGTDQVDTRDASSVTYVDVTPQWNSVALQYHFSQKTAGTTFVQSYMGPNFASDFAAIKASIWYQLHHTIQPLDDPAAGTSGNGVLSIRVENWPTV